LNHNHVWFLKQKICLTFPINLFYNLVQICILRLGLRFSWFIRHDVFNEIVEKTLSKILLSKTLLCVTSVTANTLMVNGENEVRYVCVYKQGMVVQPITIIYWRLPQLIGYLPS
jgi:hypothetical protein